MNVPILKNKSAQIAENKKSAVLQAILIDEGETIFYWSGTTFGIFARELPIDNIRVL